MIAKKPKAHILTIVAALLIAQANVAPVYGADEPATPPTLATSSGAGDLLVAPTRVVLEGRTRAVEVVLNSKSNQDATYRISFTHLRMKEDGTYEELTEEAAKSTLKTADDIVRYSPRQVTLKPGETQVVKVMMRKPEGLADGEYTSHLLFRAVPDMATGEDVEKQKTEDGKISIRLIPVYGVSIPVLVRQGDLSAQAKLENATINNGQLSVTLTRTGTKSVFGDVIATQSGSKNVVGQLRGIGIMAYNNKRNVSFPVTAASGPITIEYREREEDGGKVLDKMEIK